MFALIMIFALPAGASAPYQTYTYSINGTALHSPDAYNPVKTIDAEYMGLTDPAVLKKYYPSLSEGSDELEKKMFDGIKIQGIMLSESDVAEKIEPEKESKKEPKFISCEKDSQLNETDMKKWIKGAEEKAKETAEKIISGEIEIKPTIISGFNACDYCEYKSICSDK